MNKLKISALGITTTLIGVLGFTALTNVYGDTVTPTPESCFTTTNIDGGVAITGYNTSCGLDVVIPSTIGGKTVVQVGSDNRGGDWCNRSGHPDGDIYPRAPFYKKGINSVVIPDTVKRIAHGSFYGNKLTTVEMPSSIETICNYAFYYNPNGYGGTTTPVRLTCDGFYANPTIYTNSNVIRDGPCKNLTSYTLRNGEAFSSRLKQLAGCSDTSASGECGLITAFKKSDTPAPTGTTTLSIGASSDDEIIAWFTGGTIYYYSDKPIKMNSDSKKMFKGLTNLTDISGVSDWDASNVTNLSETFYGCNSLANISHLSQWNITNVTNINDIFNSCSSITDPSPIEQWNTSNVTSMVSAFYGCGFEEIDLSQWNTSKVTASRNMFQGCSNLTKINGLDSWDTSKVTTMKYMFAECPNLTELDLSAWDTSNVSDMSYMFFNDTGLTTIYVSDKFVVNSSADASNMFLDSTSIVGGKGTVYDETKVGRDYAKIDLEGQSGYFTALGPVVKFNANGGLPGTYTKMVKSGSIISRPADPTRANSTFGGWYIDNDTFANEFDFSTPITDDITIYAKFTCDDGYTLSSNGKSCNMSDGTVINDFHLYFVNDDSDVTHYTIMDRNLGASAVGSGGNYYQWGNNHGFTYPLTNTSSDQIPYNVWHYYEDYPSTYSTGIFVIGSSNWQTGTQIQKYNNNLWGGKNDTTFEDGPGTRDDRQGPCPNNYYVPSAHDAYSLVKAWVKSYPGLNGVDDSVPDNTKGFHDEFASDLLFVVDAGINYTNGSLMTESPHLYGVLWTSSPLYGQKHNSTDPSVTYGENSNDNNNARVMYFKSGQFGSYTTIGVHNKGYGYHVRCFKDDFDPAGTTGSLTIHPNGGKRAIITMYENGDIVQLGSPIREGYTFQGWYTTEDFQDGTEVNATTNLAGVTDLYAQWNKYQIRFLDEDGTVLQDLGELSLGVTPTEPSTTPTKTGYIFAGWNPTIEPVRKAQDYVATYNVEPYNINYDLDGGEVFPANATGYNIETSTFTLNNPTKTGYTFAGWTGTNITGTSAKVTINQGSIGHREYTATWTRDEYTITYDLDGGEVSPANATGYNVETSTFTLNNPTKTGYTFLGWTGTELTSLNTGVTINQGSTGDRSYTANWQINQYKLIFKDYDGTILSTGTYDYMTSSGNMTIPTASRTGYTFEGWDTIPDTMPANDVVVTAQYNIISYDITYDRNGGTETPQNPDTYTVEESVTLNNPTKTGYDFLGWTGTNVDTVNSGVVIATGSTGNRHFVANWQAIDYAITYDLNSGTNHSDNPSTYTIEDTITIKEPTRIGYTFLGWTGTDVASLSTGVTIPTGSIGDRHFVANWSADDTAYKVKHWKQDLNGTGYTEVVTDEETLTGKFDSLTEALAKPYTGFTLSGTIEQKIIGLDTVVNIYYDRKDITLIVNKWNGTSDTYTGKYGQDVSVPTPNVREGYEFKGYSPDKPATFPANNLIISEVWEILKYRITFDSDGGTEVSDIYEDYNTNITKPTDPTKDGYNFTGWLENGSLFDFPSSMPARNISLTALWDAITYFINYNLDGGSVTPENRTSFTIEDETFSIKDPTKKGYNFLGWTGTMLEEISSGVVILSGSTGSRTYTANWEIINYNITYEYNSGTVGTANPTSYNIESANITLNNPTRTGYSFLGWTGTDENALSSGVTIPTGSIGHRHFVANWQVNQYTITFETDGGTLVETITQDYDTDVTAPANPTKTGYAFSGWVDENGSYYTIPSKMPAENKSLTAIWTPAKTTYTVEYYLQNIENDEYSYHTSITKTGISEEQTETVASYYTGFEAQSFSQTGILGNGSTVVKIYYNRVVRTITFDTKSGSEIAPITGKYGMNITTPADPTKTGYTFSGWDKVIPSTMPAENITITANWTPKNYTITYELNSGEVSTANATGYTIESEDITLNNPTRTGYTFLGWTGTDLTTETKNVTIPTGSIGNRHFVANWSINDYTVTIITSPNGYGTVDKEEVVANYNTTISESENILTIGSTGVTATPNSRTDQYTYTFSGWINNCGEKLTQNCTITAEFTRTVNQYEITWKDGDGNTLKTGSLDYGEMPVYNGETPTKTPTQQYTYTFNNNWSPEISSVTGAITYTAQFDSTVNKYTVTIISSDTNSGTVSSGSITDEYGTEISLSGDTLTIGTEEIVATPSANTQQYTFEFVNWTNTCGDEIQDDCTITANFKSTVNQYEVTFYDENKTRVLKETKLYDYGTIVEDIEKPENDPEKDGYTFIGWNPPLSTVTGSVEYIAQYTPNTDIFYTVKYVHHSSSNELSPSKVVTGQTMDDTITETGITIPGYRLADGEEETKTLKLKSKDNVITFTYTERDDTPYTVKHFKQNLDGSYPTEATDTENKSGTTNSEVTPPVKNYDGFNSPTAQTVTISPDGDTVVEYRYTRKDITITFDTDGGTEISPITGKYQADVIFTDTTTKTGYTFSGWNVEIPNTFPAEDLTVKAIWNINEYKITFDSDGGTPVNEMTFDYDEDITGIPESTKTGYTFSGWAPTLPEKMPANNLNVKAEWIPNTDTEYKVHHYKEKLGGGYEETPSDIDNETGTTGEQTNAQAKSYTGFTKVDFEQKLIEPDGTTIVQIFYTRNKYEVKFVNWDNEELQTEMLPYGDIPVFKGIDPEKPATAEKTYVFSTWSPSIATVTGAITYTAQFADSTNSYKITIVSNDTNSGTVTLGEVTKEYGTSITFSGYKLTIGNTEIKAIPSDNTQQFTFKLNKWQTTCGENMIVEKDCTITANFESVVNKYTVTFVDWDDTFISSGSYDYGTASGDIIKPTDPTKDADNTYTYTFAGWNTIPDKVTDHVIIKATYESHYIDYTVTWEDYDGTTLSGATYHYNDDLIVLEDPSRDADETYTYTFSGWTPDISAKVTTGVTYTATYTPHYIDYTIEFVNWDDTFINSGSYHYGDTVIPPNTDSLREGYTFIRWEPEVKTVTGSQTYKAILNPNTDIFYTVKYVHHSSLNDLRPQRVVTGQTMDDTITETGITIPGYRLADGEEETKTLKLKSSNNVITFTYTERDDTRYKVEHYKQELDGSYPTNPDDTDNLSGTTNSEVTPPVKTYAGFNSPTAQTVTISPNGDTVVEYRYTRKDITITFDTDGGTEITPISGKYRADVIFTDTTTKTGYTFSGWNVEIPNTFPAEDLTVKAIWNINEYKITFNSDGGSPVNEMTFKFDETITGVPTPTKTGYVFAGWNPILPAKMPAENLEVTAQWQPKWDTPYKVIHLQENINDENYTEKEVENLTGQTDSEITPPVKNYDGFNSPTTQTVTISPNGDTEVIYKYSRNTYTITFDTKGGNNIPPITGKYGKSVNVPNNPEKEGYIFAGWVQQIPSTIPAGNITIEASWTKDSYKITFNTDGGTPVSEMTFDYDEEITGVPTPTKTGYTFNGWDPILPAKMPARNLEVTAKWGANWDTVYKVYHFKQELDGSYPTDPSEIENKSGETGKDTQAEAKDYSGFTLSGNITQLPINSDGSTIVQIFYTRNSYTVTWLDGDGNELTSNSVKYGETPVYSGDTPTKTATDEFTYTFNNTWSPEILAVTGSITYTAQFDSTVNKYTIKFVNEDGTELQSSEFSYGETPVYSGDTPTKTATDEFTYVFNGWDPDIVSVTGVATYIATYTNTTNTYTVRWLDHNGDELEKDENVSYGTTPEYNGNEPTKSQTGYIFEFSGWQPNILSVTKNIDYTAKFTYTLVEYKIEYELNNGSLADGETNLTGYTIETPDFTLKKPTREGYDFTGWKLNSDDQSSPEITVVINQGSTGDRKYIAHWEAKDVEYTVNHHKQNIDNDYYTLFEYQTLSGKYDNTTEAVEKDYTGFTVQTFYQKTIGLNTVIDIYYDRNTHTVTYNSNGGSEVSSKTLKYGATIPTPEISKTGYNFGGWDNNPGTMPDNNVTLDAIWQEADGITYTVEHYQEDLNGGYNSSPTDTETRYGTTGQDTQAVSKTYTGFVVEEPIDQQTISPDGDTIVKIYYNRKIVYITYSDGTNTETLTGKYDTPVTPPTDPEKEGYEFDGWENLPDNYPENDIGVIAKWKPKDNTPYKVIHLQENVNDAGFTEVDSQNLVGTTDLEVEPEVNSYTGFVSPPKQKIKILADGSAVLEYKYTRKVVNITFKNGDDEIIVPGKYGQPVVPPQPNPEKPGFTFGGWNGITPTFEDDVVVEPIWEIKDYDIGVNSSTGGTVIPDKSGGNLGDTIILTVNPEPGYELETIIASGITINENEPGKKYSFIVPDNDVEITPVFKKIIYNINGYTSDGGSITPEVSTGSIGDEIKLEVNIASGYRLKPGTIKILDENNNPVPYDPNTNSFIMPAGGISIFAEFEIIPEDSPRPTGGSSSVRECKIEDFDCSKGGYYVKNAAVICNDEKKIGGTSCKIDEEKVEEIIEEEIPELNAPEEINTGKISIKIGDLDENISTGIVYDDGSIEFCWRVYNNKDFIDIKNSFAREYIIYLANRGIVHGYRTNGEFDGTYRPGNEITRAEFLKIALRSRCKDNGQDYSKTAFIDVNEGSWIARVVNRAVELGIVSTKNNEFRPDDPITREEALKILFLVRKIDVELSEDFGEFNYEDIEGWSAKYVEAARELGIISDRNTIFRPTSPISREESSKLVHGVMNAE